MYIHLYIYIYTYEYICTYMSIDSILIQPPLHPMKFVGDPH